MWAVEFSLPVWCRTRPGTEDHRPRSARPVSAPCRLRSRADTAAANHGFGATTLAGVGDLRACAKPFSAPAQLPPPRPRDRLGFAIGKQRPAPRPWAGCDWAQGRFAFATEVARQPQCRCSSVGTPKAVARAMLRTASWGTPKINPEAVARAMVRMKSQTIRRRALEAHPPWSAEQSLPACGPANQACTGQANLARIADRRTLLVASRVQHTALARPMGLCFRI